MKRPTVQNSVTHIHLHTRYITRLYRRILVSEYDCFFDFIPLVIVFLSAYYLFLYDHKLRVFGPHQMCLFQKLQVRGNKELISN